jgi:signal transduction histidine kinase
VQEAREQLIREQAARAEAERDRERREQFLAAAAHDLKTPLTAIRALMQLAERRVTRGNSSAEDLSSMFDQVKRAVRRMTSLLDELLDVTRMQMDRPLALNRRVVDLRTVVGEVIEEHRGVSERHELVFEPPATEVRGSWDPARLDRVVGNLVANAIKYSPDGGRVTVRLGMDKAPEGERARIEVEDQGIGIPADDLPHVFERFHRAGNVGHLGGTGIGLAYVREVVEEHGGTIEVRSQVARGTTVTIHLPLQEGPPHE